MKKSKVAIRVDNLHKEFILPQSKNTSLKSSFVNIVRKNNKTVQKVLDGVSFDVNEGDFFGVVGRNGSGKSTLLKLLAGVYTPTSGEIEINGGLTPFIELGVGFNPELSGRDNVFLNGALLGFTHKQMEEMYDEIVEFAELEQFMDQKLKNYSSGMQVRLAFSVAIKAKNKIMIFDEVLAVGDAAFQRKCLDVFEEYKAKKQTIILVTHDMETVKKFCNKAVLVQEGKITKSGNTIEVADEYSRLNLTQIVSDMNKRTKQNSLNNKQQIKIEILDSKTKQNKKYVSVNETVNISISWNNKEYNPEVIMLDLFKLSGEHVTNFKSSRDLKKLKPSVNKKGQINLMTKLSISPGKYYFNASLRRDRDDSEIVAVYNAVEFIIKEDWSQSKTTWSGLVNLDHEWKMTSEHS